MNTGLPLAHWSTLRNRFEREAQAASWARRFALLAGLVLISSFLSILYHITDVIGGTAWLVGGAVTAFLVGTIAARRVPLTVGLGVGVVLFSLGLGSYLLSLPNPYRDVLSPEMLADLVALSLGNMSVFQIIRADLWAVLIAPAPVYGTWYLLGRRHYGLGAWVGGSTLVFFVLTGDAAEWVTLVGVASVLGVLGFGMLDRSGASWNQIRTVGMLLATVIVVTRLSQTVTARLRSASKPPAGPNIPATSQPPPLEASLLDAPNRISILGSISLSSNVRFTVTAARPAFWRVAAYDRFTGQSWVRSGETTRYGDALAPPPGQTQSLHQTFEAEAPVNTMPAAWKPVRVADEVVQRTRVTALGGLQPTRSMTAGESYSVTSEQPQWTKAQLRAAPDDVPEPVRNRYLQVPNSTPDRVGQFVAELTADVDTRFQKAALIQQWLEAEKEYALDVTRPTGNIADAFLFEMEQGYCVYYATAMTIMLRTLGIPARFTVGYTTGQSVAADQWVIRGFNSHAWVEVFFPDIGWVPFNPTPSGPRQATRQQRLEAARAANQRGIDTQQTRPTATPSQRLEAARAANQSETDTAQRRSTATPSPTSVSASGNTTSTATGVGRAPEIETPASSTDREDLPTDVDIQRGAITAEEELLSANTSRFQPQGQESSAVARRDLFTNLVDGDQVAILAGFAGIVLGLTRVGLVRRGYRFVSLRWQFATNSPQRDIERAFDRLEQVFARQYRERQPGETRRAYVEALETAGHADERLCQILDTYENARYKGEASREHADEVMRLVDAIVHEHLSILLVTRQPFGDD